MSRISRQKWCQQALLAEGTSSDARSGQNRTGLAIEPQKRLHEQVDHEALRAVAEWRTSSVAPHRGHQVLLAAPSFMLGGHHAEGGVVTHALCGLGTASRSLVSGFWIGVRENLRDQEWRLESKVP